MSLTSLMPWLELTLLSAARGICCAKCMLLICVSNRCIQYKMCGSGRFLRVIKYTKIDIVIKTAGASRLAITLCSRYLEAHDYNVVYSM